MKNKIFGIIIGYNTPKTEINRLRQELRELFDAQSIVVDNTKNNTGFASAVNEGISLALAQGGDTFLVCNPDISFRMGNVDSLKNAAKHFDIFSGYMQQDNITYYGGKIDYWTMAGGLSTNKPIEHYSACDFVSGSFMCINKKTVETIGLFSLQYFLYYEDTDYCLRARRKGLSVGITDGIRFRHMENSKKFPTKSYYLARNRLMFLFTYGSLLHKIRETIRMPFLMAKLYLDRTPQSSLQLQGYTAFIYGKKISH